MHDEPRQPPAARRGLKYWLLNPVQQTRNLNPEFSPWPHRFAVLLCCATFPLLWVGGLVTTYQAGMAVPDWPNTYGYNLFLYPISTWIYGPWDLFVEHGHRLFGSLIGLLTIAFCVSVWSTRQPKWLRVMAFIAVAGVVLQGVLGGMRVLLDERTLAKIHGCVGPAFFAYTAALATVTSRRWRLNSERRFSFAVAPDSCNCDTQHRVYPTSGWRTTAAFRTRWLAVAVPLISGDAHCGCRCLGTADSGDRLPVLRQTPRMTRLVLPATLLVALVFVQLTLGAATWIVKYGPPAFMSTSNFAAEYTVEGQSIWQTQITTAHVATGSLILAIATALAVQAAGLKWTSMQSESGMAVGELKRTPAKPQATNVHPFAPSLAHVFC